MRRQQSHSRSKEEQADLLLLVLLSQSLHPKSAPDHPTTPLTM